MFFNSLQEKKRGNREREGKREKERKREQRREKCKKREKKNKRLTSLNAFNQPQDGQFVQSNDVLVSIYKIR